MKSIDESLKAFEIYKSSISLYRKEDLTESDTRSKLIDNMLINVLGWDEKWIRREGYVNKGYYDYKVEIPGISFILEAKKKFIEFKLPANHKTSSLKSLLAGNKREIDQVRDYAIEVGIPYAILTNGSQFILMKVFNNDGTNWKNNMCLIFNGLEDIHKRYIEFYDNLSQVGVVHNGGFKYSLPVINFNYKTILSSLINKDKELIRNSFSAGMAPTIDRIFGEIFIEEREDDIELIKYCFVENEETKKNKGEIEKLFSDKAPELSSVIPATNSVNIANQIMDEIKVDEIAISNTSPPKPIILIGSKGAGKTTFINHLFKYKLDGDEFENHFLIYVDFRKFYESDLGFEANQIAGEIIEKIYTKYDHLELHSLKILIRIYRKEIKRHDENTWSWDKANDLSAYNKKLSEFLEEVQSDKLSHLEHLSKYLIRERRKRLIIIIDNADQFNEIIQGKIFLFAHALSRSSLCGTIIAIREGYYYKRQNTPPFDAYESNVYHISAPPYVEILQKRIDFAILKAPKLEKKVKMQTRFGEDYEFSSKYIIDFLEIIKNSLYNLKNTQIIDYLNFTTYPNIREGLRVFKTFLTSGHTKASQYIFRQLEGEKDENYIPLIPFHEFVKSITLQNKHYYNSDNSITCNLFTPPEGSEDHFIKLYVLKDLSEFVQARNHSIKSTNFDIVLSKYLELGYTRKVIIATLKSLLENNLIDTDEQLTDTEWVELPDGFNLAITNKGHYYLTELCDKFLYIDLILQDTPIFNMEYFELILNSFPHSSDEGSRSISLRIENAGEFLKYLKYMEEKQPFQVRTACGELLDRIIAQVKEQTKSLATLR